MTSLDVMSSDFDFLDRADVPVKQGSAQWLQERVGKVTGSRIKDVMAYRKTGDKGETQKRADYRIELVAEILTGKASQHFVSEAMVWGTEQEQFARAAYEVSRGTVVDEVGFVPHPSIERSGGSPDGLIGEDGGLEIKCPETTTHIEWIMGGKVPDEHQAQMLFYMACTERKWWDFVSFDSRLPERYQLFVVRMPRDDARIAEIEAEIRKFLGEIDATISKLEAL